MGCTLSSGQISLSFDKSLQCMPEGANTLVLTSSVGVPPASIDENLGKLLGFSLTNTNNTLPYIKYIGIGNLTSTVLNIDGAGGVTDPRVTAIIHVSIDQTQKFINLKGSVINMRTNEQLAQIPLFQIDIKAHVNLSNNYPSCIDIETDVIPKLPTSFVTNGVTSGTYTYFLKSIKFLPISTQDVSQIEKFDQSENKQLFSLSSYVVENKLMILLLLILLFLMYKFSTK